MEEGQGGSAGSDELLKALCKQVEVDLRLVKGWQETSTVWEGGLFFVRGSFDRAKRHVVVAHAASSTLSPEQMQRWFDVTRAEVLTVAIVERDGATSYFELSALQLVPPTLPPVYHI